MQGSALASIFTSLLSLELRTCTAQVSFMPGTEYWMGLHLDHPLGISCSHFVLAKHSDSESQPVFFVMSCVVFCYASCEFLRCALGSISDPT